ncbi:uncharacterized protein [Littorina saxatilis]|uniref:uncharacterized protein n=1 Tax=Littorina saxatilis TaxID=31220 RepID=UPI0038B4CFEC
MLLPGVRQSISSAHCPSLSGLFVLTVQVMILTSVQAADWQWVTVMAVNKSEPPNPYDLLMQQGPLNDKEGKETQEPYTLVTNGNFKSSMLDDWANYKQEKVRIILYDKYGYPMWYVDFKKASGGKSPDHWMSASTITSTSDYRVRQTDDVTLGFNEQKLELSIHGNTDRRLQMTWSSSGQEFFLFSTVPWDSTKPPLSLPLTSKTHEDMVQDQLPVSYNKTEKILRFSGNNSGLWIYFPVTHYMVGMSVKKNITEPGELTSFTLDVTIDANCKPYRPVYDSGTNTAKVFTLNYTKGPDNSFAALWFDEVVAAQCLAIHGTISAAHNTSFYFYDTEYEVIDAPIFAIQWYIDVAAPPSNDTVCETKLVCTKTLDDVAVLEQHQKELLGLVVQKEDTSKFKRQFISAPDNRPTARLMGAVGIICISLVVLSVVVLDFQHACSVLNRLRKRIKHTLPWASKPPPRPLHSTLRVQQLRARCQGVSRSSSLQLQNCD